MKLQHIMNKHNIDTKAPFIIGLAGGTASGKTTVASTLMRALGQENDGQSEVVTLSQDSFYRELNQLEIAAAEKGMFNFDHPDAFDNDLMESILKNIVEGKQVQVPVYDFKTHSRVPGVFTVIKPGHDVVMVEGILVFYFSKIREMFDLKLFVDTDPDTRLARRVLRDLAERGRDLQQVLAQYTDLVKPAFDEFCFPTKKWADVIVPRGAENTVALNLIQQYIQDIIRKSRQESPNGNIIT